ncbi:MAG: sensor histidine kinase, partial [Deltaproteobacteria bacterium]|nr:sensor histidine kinase [Deltaproteobacteria bacterium]
MSITRISRAELLAENEALRFRLEEAEDTLHAIKSGGVDALVVSSPDGEQVFTLQGADHSYRLLVESMNEGAATLTADGTIVYCNNRLATMLHVPIEKLIGSALASHVDPADYHLLAGLLGGMKQNNENEEISLISGAETRLPVLISSAVVDLADDHAVSVVLTDISVRKSRETSVQERSAELSLINT